MPDVPGSTTFVTCIEAGLLEKQVVLLARSLRALDTDIARMGFVAVQPRRDIALARETHCALAELNVRVVSERLVTAFDWNPHLNKAAAMAWAERNVTSPFLTWLDSDLVFLRPPEGLIPDAGTSFVAMSANIDQGTDGTDANAPYWERVSQIVGVPYQAAALIPSTPPAKPIFEYYHGGIYTVRTADRISHAHQAFFLKLLEARIASQSCGTFHHDQVSLSMAVRTAPGARRLYSWEMNYSISPRQLDQIDPAMLARAMVLHYHDAFLPKGYAMMQGVLEALPEGPRQLIAAAAPITTTIPVLPRLIRRIRGRRRRLLMQKHKMLCETV